MRPSTLLDLTDSDSDFSRVDVPKKLGKMPAEKKPRGRAAANRVTKAEPKPATRRADSKKAAVVEQELERQALAEKVTNQAPKSTRGRKAKKVAEKEEKEEEETGDVLATPPGSDEPARKKGGRGRPRKESVVPDSIQKNDAPINTKRGRRRKAEDPVPQPDEPSEIPETQADDAMDVDDTEEQDHVEDLPTFSRLSVPPSVQHINSYHVPLSASKRSTSSLSLESDPSIRRRLGEMTKKYETLEVKYKDLRNVAVTEAEKSFDRLKKTSEDRAQGMCN